MTFSKKIGTIALALIITLVMSTPILSDAAELPILLNTADSFAVLAGQSITNTGTSVINGDIGTSPGSSFTPGPAVINGVVHSNDAVAITAQQHLVDAYNDASTRLPETTIDTELGGSTLLPGYYTSLTGTFGLTGTLTLDGDNRQDAIFVFETTTTLVTALSSNIVLINGAKSSQIFWVIGSSATLGTTSHLEGTIMAMQDITLITGATVNGSLLARNGSIVLDSNVVNANSTPLIAIDKTADTSIIYNGQGMVNYSYSISNPGLTDLENIVVTDDKINVVNLVSGDLNSNTILEPTEVWLYSASAMISGTTTNIGTVTATSNTLPVTATDQFTVTVTVADSPDDDDIVFEATSPTTAETTDATTDATTDVASTEIEYETLPSTDATVEPTEDETSESTEPVLDIESPPTSPVVPGGPLPRTATPLMLYLSSGVALIVLGALGLKHFR